MMRRVVAGAVITLLLAACDSSAEPGPDASKTPSPSPSPTTSTVQWSTEAELGAVCDALDRTVTATLPNGGTAQYVTKFHYTTGGTNAPLCGIEPDGEYYDVATKVPVFGRARFDYVRYPDKVMRRPGYLRYTPETVEDLLRVDEANPLTDEVPCVNKPCKNGIHGYQYDFRFEAVIGTNIAVKARFDYITTDVKGDKKPKYRAQAIEAFKASMEVIAAGLT